MAKKHAPGLSELLDRASVAVGLVEMIAHQKWEVLPVAAVPLYFVYPRGTVPDVNRLEEEHRRREVIESLDHGMAVDHFQHEHRIRHEDGTYRRFLCRGIAVRGAGRRPARIAGSLTDTTRASDRAGAAPQRRVPGSADRALQPRGLRGGARATPRRVQTTARRQPVRGALSRSRSLQGRQRQSRPRGGRRAAHGGVASPRVVPAARETPSPGSAETSSRFS